MSSASVPDEYGTRRGCGGLGMRMHAFEGACDRARRPQRFVRQTQARVAAELKTTFATRYAKHVSPQELLQVDELRRIAQRSAGGEHLIVPT